MRLTAASATLRGIVARLHRRHERAMVFAYAVAQLLWGLLELCKCWLNACDDTRFRFSLLAFVIVFALI